MRRVPFRSPRNAHRGYTLLEILLALGLTGILTIGIYAALQHYWRVSTLGKIDAERMQLARSLARRISVELRSAVWRDLDADAAVVEPTTVDEEMTMTTEDTALPLPAEIHLIGSPTELTFVTLRPSRDRVSMPAPDAEAVPDSESDLRRISYIFDAQGSLGGTGLYYRNVDQRQEEWAAQQGGTGLEMPEELLVPEIAELQFSYLDGNSSSWVDTWDSYEFYGLPRAVRMTIRFRPATDSESQLLATSRTSPSTETMTVTIDLPTSALPEVF